MSDELSIDDLILEAMVKSRFLNEAELMDKYEAVCKRHNVLALPGQLKAGLGRLKAAGKITFRKGQGVKKV